MKKSNDCFYNWLLLAGYLACLVFLALIHEPWGDELHSWVMARDLSLLELFSAMRVEGHFCLWFLLLMPFAKAGFGVFWLQIISIVLTLTAAWLLVFRTDFTYWTKVAVLLSFPMIYSFPIVSRCYALIPPILFGIALTYRKLNDNKYQYAFLVGLLAHTHVYMEGMVLALFVLYIYEVILPRHREKRLHLKDFGPLFVIIVFVLLAFAQVVRNPFSPVYYNLGDTKIITGTYGLIPTLRHIFKGYSILPSGLVISGLKEAIVYIIAFIPMLVLSWIIIIRSNWTKRFILIVSIGWQVLFSLFIYSFDNQRTYLPFFIFLTILITMCCGGKQKINEYTICLCLLASIPSYYIIERDILRPYSNWKELAKVIEKEVPNEEPVYSIMFSGENVTTYMPNHPREIISTTLNDIDVDSFYVITWYNHGIENYIVDTILFENGCIEDNIVLYKLHRLDNSLSPLGID